MSIVRRIVTIVLTVIVFILVVAGVYVAYVSLNYYRIGDTSLEVEGSGTSTTTTASTGTTYSIATYNIGFGAYQQDYECVLDTCYVQDSSGNWVSTSGTNLKALSAADAQNNTEGAAATLKALSPDFVFTQETDLKSDRCYGINQKQLLQNTFSGYASSYALNFHTPYLAYPLNDMMGCAQSGILTLSRFPIQSADRHEFAVTDDFISKQFDLDRCFSASYVDIDNGKQLVLVNLHMSAYDEGGVIRSQQRKQLYSFIAQESAKGNYVIAGGDFNHDLLTNNPGYTQYTTANPAFASWFTEKPIDSVAMFDSNGNADLPSGFSIVASDNWPTCRNAAIAWEPGFSQICTIDGFIVSSNVQVVSHRNVVTATDKAAGFANSDHEPAYMEFVLK